MSRDQIDAIIQRLMESSDLDDQYAVDVGELSPETVKENVQLYREALSKAQKNLAANREEALRKVEDIRWMLEAALREGGSLRKAAELLNARNIASPGGGQWHAPSVLKAARRLGLR